MKSRAPSGVLLISVGVSTSTKPLRVVDLADRLDHPAAEHQPLLHRLAADVEVAVLEAQALVDRRVRLVDVERRGLRLGQDLDVGRLELDLAGRQLRVLGARQARRDGARDRHDELGADPAGRRVGLGRIGLVDDDLGDPVAVAQVEEDRAGRGRAGGGPSRPVARSRRRRRRAARRRCGCGRAWRGSGGGRSWPAYRSRSGWRRAAGLAVAAGRSQPATRLAIAAQVLGRVAAAAADDRGARVAHRQRRRRHRLGVGAVDRAHVDELGHPRVRLGDEDRVGIGGPHPLDDRDQLVRTVAAVATDRVGAPGASATRPPAPGRRPSSCGRGCRRSSS